jgi:catechol 2,3-dioxygenase-like lactoylglutathione lyase family enzyme
MIAPFLDHVLIAGREIERSRHFYRDVLELGEVSRPVFIYPGAWFQLSGGQILHLVVRDDGTTRGDKPLDLYDVHFALRMSSYRETLAWLQRKGFRDDLPDGDPYKLALRPDSPTGRPQIYVMDPDNNIVEFICDSLD